jgi:hypothetical protein
MTTLELITDSSPYKFKSLGVQDERTGKYVDTGDFKIDDTKYELTDGKFPLTDYNDEFSQSGLYHTLNGNIKVKIIGFNGSCEEGDDFNKYGSCQIIVERANQAGGRKKRNLKSKSKRRRSNRKKSNRRKSNRRR